MHTETLKIQNFLGGDPLTPLTRGGVPSRALLPLVPLDDFRPPDHFLMRSDGPGLYMLYYIIRNI